MISKGKISTLPKRVGAGPLTLVMKEVVSICRSDIEARILIEVLQCNTKPEPGYT